jgi:hypothetical protein
MYILNVKIFYNYEAMQAKLNVPTDPQFVPSGEHVTGLLPSLLLPKKVSLAAIQAHSSSHRQGPRKAGPPTLKREAERMGIPHTHTSIHLIGAISQVLELILACSVSSSSFPHSKQALLPPGALHITLLALLSVSRHSDEPLLAAVLQRRSWVLSALHPCTPAPSTELTTEAAPCGTKPSDSEQMFSEHQTIPST